MGANGVGDQFLTVLPSGEAAAWQVWNGERIRKMFGLKPDQHPLLQFVSATSDTDSTDLVMKVDSQHLVRQGDAQNIEISSLRPVKRAWNWIVNTNRIGSTKVINRHVTRQIAFFFSGGGWTLEFTYTYMPGGILDLDNTSKLADREHMVVQPTTGGDPWHVMKSRVGLKQMGDAEPGVD